MPTQDKHS